MGSDGTSLRVNVDDGKTTVDGSHKYKDGDANAGKTPKVVAGAYTNSWKGGLVQHWLATGGALYSVDLKGGKATMAGKIEGLSGTLTDIAWFD
jgi:Domain of unknown function (DUF4394)